MAFIIILSISCNKDKDIEVCGFLEPHKNLPWLIELIEKIENDPKRYFLTKIYAGNYRGTSLIVTMLPTAGTYAQYYTCDGSPYITESGEILPIEELNNKKSFKIIYSNY